VSTVVRTASRGRGNFERLARKLSVTDRRHLHKQKEPYFKEILGD
jgi:hypothetical protein